MNINTFFNIYYKHRLEKSKNCVYSPRICTIMHQCLLIVSLMHLIGLLRNVRFVHGSEPSDSVLQTIRLLGQSTKLVPFCISMNNTDCFGLVKCMTVLPFTNVGLTMPVGLRGRIFIKLVYVGKCVFDSFRNLLRILRTQKSLTRARAVRTPPQVNFQVIQVNLSQP